jgi:DNA-binding transcriptional LysR family regulator
MPYGIQQPAISGQISQLERSLGAKLFHRRPFGLTPAGVKLFGEIEAFFAGLKQLPDHVRGHAQQLRKREIDLAITELEGRPSASIESCSLVRLRLVLTVPKRAAVRSLKDAFHNRWPVERLISLPANEVLAKHFHAGLRKLELAWAPAIEVSSVDLIDIYTSLGFGVGVSVAVPRKKMKHGLRHVALPTFPRLTIAALWIGELTELAASFLADVKKIAAAMDT